MIGLVRLSLRRPYTSAIAAMLVVLLGALSITRMIVDIFPVIDIPVVLVVWNYPGLTTEDMERRVVFITERAYSTTVNGISRIESQSIPGTGILKVYFQPGTELDFAPSGCIASEIDQSVELGWGDFRRIEDLPRP
jgi:multidrug efflux pump subunit AcrB